MSINKQWKARNIGEAIVTCIIRIREMTSLFPGKLCNGFLDLLSFHITQWFIILFLIECTSLWRRLKGPLVQDAYPLELIVKGPDLV